MFDWVGDVLDWAGDHQAQTVAVGTTVLVVWRLLARRSHADLWSGITTAALAATALAVPAGLALWWDGATSGAFWWAVAVALAAAALASTEWLRVSLRWFAVLAIVALAALLIRLGSENLKDVRCDEVHKLTADASDLDEKKTELVEAADTTAAETRATLRKAVTADDVALGLVVAAQRLVVALDSGADAGINEAHAGLDAAYRPNAASRADAALVTAADTAVSSAQALTALEGVDLAGLDPVEDDGPATVAALDGQACGDKQRLVTEVELTEARTLTAAYRSDLEPTDDNKAAAEKAATAADDAAERAARGEAEEGTDWVSFVKQGGTAAGSAALDGLPGSPEPNKWFWVALAVLLLGGWWLIERRSASMVAGPVSVTFHGVDLQESDKGKQPAKEAQQAVFVTALTKNLREPGSTPGSHTSSPLTDLEGVVTAADPSKIVAAVITALKKVLSSPRGSTVTAQVLAPLPGDKRWRVFVVVADAATGRAVNSKELADESGAEACRVAGYWASATVLSASPRLPLWARWSPATAHAFAAYDTASEPTIAALRSALREAPASSLVLHKLADQLSLAEEYADAAELYARAVVVDPTDHISVYRLAATQAALSRCDAPWSELPYSRRAAAVELLNRAAQRAGVSARCDASAMAEQQRADLKEQAQELFKLGYRRLGIPRTAFRCFRRDQRDAIGGLHNIAAKYGRRGQARATLRAAALTVKAFKWDWYAQWRAKQYASDSRSGWHVSYNLACYYALQPDDVGEAITWLETALTRPGAEELAGAWLAKDPDLEKLHAHPRFVLLVKALSSGPEES